MQAAVRPNRNRSVLPRAIPLRVARFWLVSLFFLLWACAIAGRLFVLQIVRHQEYMDRAQKQQQRTFEVAPRRGVLYDRNLHELAMTVQADSIYADPSEIADKKEAARALAAIVHGDPDDSANQRRADCQPAQRRSQLCLDRPARDTGESGQGQGARAEGHLLPEGVPALLSRQRNCGAGPGLRGRGRHRAGRPGAKIRAAAAWRCRAHVYGHGCAAARCWARPSASPSRARTWC